MTEMPENSELITIPARGHVPEVELVYPEFQSLCPVSGRHDVGVVHIRYLPGETLLESKSLRDYLASWRNLKNWQEYITEEMAERLYRACDPRWLTVEIEWAARGGIFARTVSKRGDE